MQIESTIRWELRPGIVGSGRAIAAPTVSNEADGFLVWWGGPTYRTTKTAISNGFHVFTPKINARFSWMPNTYMMDSNDRNNCLRAGCMAFCLHPAQYIFLKCETF